MSVRACLIAAAATALAGALLRLAVPVLPADDAYRAVVAFYGSLAPRPASARP